MKRVALTLIGVACVASTAPPAAAETRSVNQRVAILERTVVRLARQNADIKAELRLEEAYSEWRFSCELAVGVAQDASGLRWALSELEDGAAWLLMVSPDCLAEATDDANGRVARGWSVTR